MTRTRIQRHAKIRKTISGNADRPRLAVFRSNKFISVQLVDDAKGHTLAAARAAKKKPKDVGRAIAELAKAKRITQVVFDRGGYRYAGKVRAVAEGAREGGLVF